MSLTTKLNVGFIGLGTMGFPMARNLAHKLQAGSKLFAFDISAASLARLQKSCPADCVQLCRSAKEVAENADVVFTMVPEGAHVRKVYLDPAAGVLMADINGKILIDCSTIDTATSEDVRRAIEQKSPSTSFYDAPVSGGSLGAEDGTLTLMVGVSEDDENVDTVRTLLGTMGRSIFLCGGPSMGLTAKLCNNYCSGLIAIATAEAMNIGMKSGIDPRTLAKVFATSTAQSTICDKWNPVPGICPTAPSSKDYQGGFKIQLMKKDFALALDAAQHVGASLSLGPAGLNTYVKASEDPMCRDKDSRVVFRYLGGDEYWMKRAKPEKS